MPSNVPQADALSLKERQLVLLRAAKTQLLSGWCQDDFSQDIHGAYVPSYSEDACKWCAMGALMHASYHAFAKPPAFFDERDPIVAARYTLIDLLDEEATKRASERARVPGDDAYGLVAWNDRAGQTVGGVIGVFDAVIDQLEKEDEPSPCA
jgi:hypothetical protein